MISKFGNNIDIGRIADLYEIISQTWNCCAHFFQWTKPWFAPPTRNHRCPTRDQNCVVSYPAYSCIGHVRYCRTLAFKIELWGRHWTRRRTPYVVRRRGLNPGLSCEMGLLIRRSNCRTKVHAHFRQYSIVGIVVLLELLFHSNPLKSLGLMKFNKTASP